MNPDVITQQFLKFEKEFIEKLNEIKVQILLKCEEINNAHDDFIK